MIQDLPQHNDFDAYYSEPLLEYVVNFSNQHLKCYDKRSHSWVKTLAPEVFCQRLFNGDIKKIESVRNNFERTTETTETICAYGLDVEKFWYLCLFLKDYAEGQTIIAARNNPTHREELNLLIEELGKLSPKQQSFIDKIRKVEPASPCNRPKAQENIIKTLKDGRLTIKIGEDRPFTIVDGQTLVILRELLLNGLRYMPRGNSSYLDTAPPFPYNASRLGVPYQVAQFHNFMQLFLGQYKANKEYKGSINKQLLISRLIYLLDIDSDPRYYVTADNINVKGKINHLKSTIKRYKNVELPVQNKYYQNII